MSQSRCSQCHDPRDALKRFSSCLWRKKVLDGVIAIGQTTSKVSFLLRSSLPCFGSLPSLPSMRFLSLSTFSLCILLFRLPFCLTISLQSFRLCRCINWNLIVKVKTTVSDWFTHGQYTVKNCLRVPSIPSLSPPPVRLFFTLSYPEHPIPYPMESFSGEQYLFLGAIVQPGITPPVVLDYCERSFFLRSYINRLRSAAKRDPTSTPWLRQDRPVSLVVLPFLLLPPSRREESLSSGTTWPGTCIAARIISSHFRMPVHFRPVGPLFPRVFSITAYARVRGRERERSR